MRGKRALKACDGVGCLSCLCVCPVNGICQARAVVRAHLCMNAARLNKRRNTRDQRGHAAEATKRGDDLSGGRHSSPPFGT
uniref:Secreted protein n=1 Tax=Decurrovirus sp. TaxID=2832697 RepID=A0AAU8HXG5_9CAUD